MNLIDKIQALRDRFVKGHADNQDIKVIESWYEEAKKLMLLKSLKDHDGVKYVLEIFQLDIKKINEQLQSAYSKDLKDTERDRLLDRRDLARKYVSLFDGVEDGLERLEEIVDNEDSK